MGLLSRMHDLCSTHLRSDHDPCSMGVYYLLSISLGLFMGNTVNKPIIYVANWVQSSFIWSMFLWCKKEYFTTYLLYMYNGSQLYGETALGSMHFNIYVLCLYCNKIIYKESKSFRRGSYTVHASALVVMPEPGRHAVWTLRCGTLPEHFN